MTLELQLRGRGLKISRALCARNINTLPPQTKLPSAAYASVIVFGSRELNNNTRICCQTFVNELKENCTTLIVYGKVNIFLPFI